MIWFNKYISNIYILKIINIDNFLDMIFFICRFNRFYIWMFFNYIYRMGIEKEKKFEIYN